MARSVQAMSGPVPVLALPARWPLFGVAATKAIERLAIASLPAHTLMRRAGLGSARLAMALAPHAKRVWIAAGPGNNGGDGMQAAAHLQVWGKSVTVTWLGSAGQAGSDAADARQRAGQAGVAFADAAPEDFDLCLDALLGIGATRAPQGRMAQWIEIINRGHAPVLAIDTPTGLDADTGSTAASCVRASATLCLLSIKPGLFTAGGRDAAGQLWFDGLQAAHGGAAAPYPVPADAVLLGEPSPRPRPHASHKGSYGEVAVVGGAIGMTGAALMAACAALHYGAGRVYLVLLDPDAPSPIDAQPELMARRLDALALDRMTLVCGCGGGDAVRDCLPKILSSAPALVLDADALNAIAHDTQLQSLLRARARRGWRSVLTPHPLEAARLLGISAAQVQGDRLAAAGLLSRNFGCVAVLKGSGTVVAAPGELPAINPSGNARLASAGTGDVLAGAIGAALAAGLDGFSAACEAVYLHGQCADRWPPEQPLTAMALARRLGPAR